MTLLCKRDTNGDGDCHLCHRCGGCPVVLFRPCEIDAAMMTDDQVREFKRDAQPFEYTEELGTIKGFRNRDGKVLITESSLSS
jgi:hypothetical protein